MKKSLAIYTLSFILTAGAQADSTTITGFFERPVSCPLRLSNLSSLRDQVQLLTSSLGPECAKNGTAANLNSTVANLEGITTTFNNYNSDEKTQETQYAKNVNQLLGGLNTLTSNTACLYDIKSRGLLPVISDVVMSVSQLGLLVPSGTGMMLAAGGYVAGSGLKIVNELIKDKFNFNKSEDRRSFIQLNCAFFDSRRTMEEAGIFDLATEAYRQEFAAKLRKERAQLLKEQRERNQAVGKMEGIINESIKSLDEAQERNLDPILLKQMDELASNLSSRPGDYASKWKQVLSLSKVAENLLTGLNKLVLEKESDALNLLGKNLTKMIPLLKEGEKAWTSNIDEWEINFRGPLMAFLVPVANSLRSEISILEGELALNDQKSAKSISSMKAQVRDINSNAWILSQRISSLETKINKLETSSSKLFSENDEGTSNEVEILENYRKLQNAILGKSGSAYLSNAIQRSYELEEAIEKLLPMFNQARSGKEKCAAADKLRFAWTQYRFKVQEAHDFVATNMDLYRSSFRVGKEKVKKHMLYVLEQIDSVEDKQQGLIPEEDTVGELMNNVENKVDDIESKLHKSACF